MNLPRLPWVVWAVTLLLVMAITLPYVYAVAAAGDSFVFNGFLLNPVDGNSYLAKMYQGWRGSWLFTLPYTAEPGQGAYLFLFYLFLGHLGRFMGLPLLVVYHAARLASAAFLLIALYRFCRRVLPEARLSALAFALAVLGSGLGWLVLPFGRFTSDFWVAEAFPFLSAYTNPHFPLSLGMALWILTPPHDSALEEGSNNLRSTLFGGWSSALLALALSVLSPFAVVVVLAVLACVAVLGFISRPQSGLSRVYASRALWTAVGGLPILVYDQLAIWRSPQLRAWNAQNVTPAPPLWDLVISFSPVLLLALVGGWRLWKQHRQLSDRTFSSWLVPLVWAVLGLVMMYLPFNLQRRFILGLYVPLSLLAVWGLDWLASLRPRLFRPLVILLFLFVLPTNLLVLLAARHGVQQHDPLLYTQQGEAMAFQWLRQNASAEALILASPRTGLLIPAQTGQRVIYGHPYETVQADQEEQAVLDFFSGNMNEMSLLDFIDQHGVDYIFYGSQERALGGLVDLSWLQADFRSGDVTIYSPPSAELAARAVSGSDQVTR